MPELVDGLPDVDVLAREVVGLPADEEPEHLERAGEGSPPAGRCLAVTALVDIVQAHAAELAAEFEQRGTWADDGATSAAAWIAARTHRPRGEVARRTRMGTGLRRLLDVAAAVGRGEVSLDHARRIVHCARKTPGFGPAEEALLLEQARELGVDHFRLFTNAWRSAAEDADRDDAPDVPARREFVHLSQTFDGWWRLDGAFGPENGQLVAALLDEYVDKGLRAQRDGDPSLEALPVSSLRAEALVDVVAHHQRCGPKHSVADRYRVAVVIRPDESPLEACDSDLYRLVMNARGEVLDIGRTSRLWTPPIRRAVTNRDRGCVFPGCDRPPSWCDIHHCWTGTLAGRPARTMEPCCAGDITPSSTR